MFDVSHREPIQTILEDTKISTFVYGKMSAFFLVLTIIPIAMKTPSSPPRLSIVQKTARQLFLDLADGTLPMHSTLIIVDLHDKSSYAARLGFQDQYLIQPYI